MPDPVRGRAANSPLIFVVEDDADIAELTCHNLRTNGFATRWFPGSSSVIDEAMKADPALFILDVMIPGIDGFELCRHIRQVKSLATAPIIFLTAKVTDTDRVKGFELGCDDYITKPFSPRELVARVRAVLRRLHEPEQAEVLKLGGLEIDVSSMVVKVEGQIVPTTTREFRLLHYFGRHVGRVFTREQLLDAVWTESSFVTLRSIDVYVRRIREKIETDPQEPRYLKTLRGAGYRFDLPK